MSNIQVNPAIITIQTQLPGELCDIIQKQYSPLSGETEDAHTRTWDVDHGTFKQTWDHKVRKTEVKWIPEHEWIAGMVTYFVDNLNKHHFQYDISGISGSHFQYSVYQDGGHYDWHSDEPRNLYYLTTKHPDQDIRKLSFSLQLTDPSEYEGGDLCFRGENNEGEIPQPKERGTLILFDSRMDHRVTPVTSGVRHALVGWYVGPMWR